MQVANHYFENGITHFTRRINKCISYGCANGEVAPFVGHNAFLRWSAVQDTAFDDPDDGKRKQWSESNVSEDFDLALRLLSPEEVAQEPWKSMRYHATLLQHTVDCERAYYKAYAEKLEHTLERVWGEHRFLYEQLQKSQQALLALREQVSASGGGKIGDIRSADEEVESEDCTIPLSSVMLGT
ncbi:glycosyl transferase family group 2-domain-containing protein [Mycena sp. CBHHK59/15]|nr:glycosyl transferase family group 2-domain-containing protein [Mycena sp. CBHHK59/15]